MAAIARVRASLRVLGDSLEPDEVSALLGRAPTRSARKGEKIAGSQDAIEPTGAWILDSAQSERAEIAANLHRLCLAVQAEVRQAVIDLADAQGRIRLQRENLETAHENRRVIQAAYLAGKETLTRLNEVQRDYIEADASLSLARIRLRLAWTDLHAAAAIYREP